MKKIGVFTSGGDAPGMNAAIRAVVRTAISSGVEVTGILQGYVGMIENKMTALQMRDMANIIQRGGTILKTGRSAEFLKPEYRKKAADNLKSHSIDGLICIGGDGSFRGAQALWAEYQIPIIGIAGTIDNDVYGCDDTIGFDTAVNTALSAIDKIRDTADSHDRIFIVEVMGRDSGYIASAVGVAGGAEEILTPENIIPVDKIVEKLKESRARGKTSSILITAEGQKPGRAYDLADSIRKKSGLDAKVCILGHQQRGGSPTANDRILASRLGHAAVLALLAGKKNLMIGSQGKILTEISLAEATTKSKTADKTLIHLARALSV
ncbi:MAG: 6-phosphofructokinase [Bdellovibrionales bacterium RIFCSPHIGHO2_01_FULL_40_29]|nr:MAG: 6-phosphofructokinase [Bdellovibrionales bacterium RIFCSPHIGHO2_01_FULL_40_29]OFZ32910.1 MAG: 6-phosphofructokinase [Bdellovibrionales bacterium RIFCSPHIGHO2_02_FULL_40_15]